MLKKLVVGVSALVLAGGAFMTAQALTTDGQKLPTINAPLTVAPAGSRTTGPAVAAPTSPGTSTTVPCRDDNSAGTEDHHGRGSDDGSLDCHHLQTVVPNPSVFTNGHVRHGEAEPGDDHGRHTELEPGDDHGGQGEAEPGDDHGGSGGSGSGGGDDHGGRG